MPNLPAERPICGAKKRQGDGVCQKWAGWGTDHVGEGRCKLHGGSSPIRHGRYSTVRHTELRELIERMEEDPTPLDATPELALARAILHRWVDRYEEFMEALLAWNRAEYEEAQDEERPPRPARIPDIRELTPLVEAVSKAVKRVIDTQQADALSLKEFIRFVNEVLRLASVYIRDAGDLESFTRDVARINVR